MKDKKLAWEVDEFQDRDLVIAEVELPSPSAEVTLPDWLRPHIVKEVTDDSKYSNYQLALDTPESQSQPARRGERYQPLPRSRDTAKFSPAPAPAPAPRH